MSHIDTPAADRRSEPIAPDASNIPGGWEPDDQANDPSPAGPQPPAERTFDAILLLVILLIGVPVLVSCIL